MMLVKIITVLGLVAIFYQDIKDRKVYWFLFPVFGICGALLHFKSTLPELFGLSLLMNLSFISILLLVVYLYAKVKIGLPLNDVFGLGDILMFVCLAGMFSTVSFMVIFISSLVLSLLLHYALNKKQKHPTVPLAGYMSLFFLCSLFGYWSGIINAVYSI